MTGCGDAGTALEAFVLGCNQVGEGSRAAGVANRWLGALLKSDKSCGGAEDP